MKLWSFVYSSSATMEKAGAYARSWQKFVDNILVVRLLHQDRQRRASANENGRVSCMPETRTGYYGNDDWFACASVPTWSESFVRTSRGS